MWQDNTLLKSNIGNILMLARVYQQIKLYNQQIKLNLQDFHTIWGPLIHAEGREKKKK